MIAAILLAVMAAGAASATAATNGTSATSATSATVGQTVSGVPAVSDVSAPASTNMPPKMVSVWRQAELENRRTADRLASGAIDSAEAARRRAAVRRAFARVCRARGIPDGEISSWQGRIR